MGSCRSTCPAMAARLTLAALWLAAAAPAQAGIAFIGLQSLGVNPARRATLERIIMTVLTEIAGANLLGPQQVSELLADPDLDRLADCIEQTACQVDFGGLSGSHLVLSGSVARLGEGHLIILRLVDVLADGETGTSQQQVEGGDSELLEAMQRQVYKLIDPSSYAGSIELTCATEGATVSVNGKEIGHCPLAEPIRGLFAGTHTIVVAKPGYRSFSVMAEVDISLTTTVTAKLQALEVQTISPVTTAAESEGTWSAHLAGTWPRWGKLSLWSGLGLGGAGALFFWRAEVAANDYMRSYLGSEAAAKKHRTFNGAAYTAWGLGGALVTTGVLLWLLDPGPELIVAPASTGAGLTLGGRW